MWPFKKKTSILSVITDNDARNILSQSRPKNGMLYLVKRDSPGAGTCGAAPDEIEIYWNLIRHGDYYIFGYDINDEDNILLTDGRKVYCSDGYFTGDVCPSGISSILAEINVSLDEFIKMYETHS